MRNLEKKLVIWRTASHKTELLPRKALKNKITIFEERENVTIKEHKTISHIQYCDTKVVLQAMYVLRLKYWCKCNSFPNLIFPVNGTGSHPVISNMKRFESSSNIYC